MSIRTKILCSFFLVAAIVTVLGGAGIAAATASNFKSVMLGGVGLTAALFLIMGYVFSGWVIKKIHWYENILDSIPFPISVTDKKRCWTFVNKAVEDMFKKSRAEFYGKPCSQWGAAICNTENCGINCLECGIFTTFFTHNNLEFKVYANYLENRKGRQIGHIEIVEDMTATSAAKKSAAAYISETVASLSGVVSEVAHKTKANSDLAARATSLSTNMKNMADKGSEQMEQMIVAVKEIDESAKVINKVIKTINEIAFQTNLLALNASVEAARAGEAGRGFAVVADEVRNLATRSATAAGETDAVIRASIEKSQLGFRIAGETAASLSEILGGLTNTDRIVAEISQSSEEQSVAIQQITQIVAEIARSSEEQSKAIQRNE